MKRNTFLMILYFNMFMITACVPKFYVAEPTYPAVSYTSFTHIDSLSPHLTWRDIEESEKAYDGSLSKINNFSYDLAIFDVKKRSNFFQTYYTKYQVNTVYYNHFLSGQYPASLILNFHPDNQH